MGNQFVALVLCVWLWLRRGVACEAPCACCVGENAGNMLASFGTTSRASVAQLVRARDCQSLGRRFDSV